MTINTYLRNLVVLISQQNMRCKMQECYIPVKCFVYIKMYCCSDKLNRRKVVHNLFFKFQKDWWDAVLGKHSGHSISMSNRLTLTIFKIVSAKTDASFMPCTCRCLFKNTVQTLKWGLLKVIIQFYIFFTYHIPNKHL